MGRGRRVPARPRAAALSMSLHLHVGREKVRRGRRPREARVRRTTGKKGFWAVMRRVARRDVRVVGTRQAGAGDMRRGVGREMAGERHVEVRSTYSRTRAAAGVLSRPPLVLLVVLAVPVVVGCRGRPASIEQRRR